MLINASAILTSSTNHDLCAKRCPQINFDRFLASRSQFDTNHRVDFYAHILPVRDLCVSAFCVCPFFLQQKIKENFAYRLRCDF